MKRPEENIASKVFSVKKPVKLYDFTQLQRFPDVVKKSLTTDFESQFMPADLPKITKVYFFDFFVHSQSAGGAVYYDHVRYFPQKRKF